jgi:hypothetical protein
VALEAARPEEKTKGGENVKESISWDFTENVRNVVQKLEKEGIEGWGIQETSNIDKYFEYIKISEPYGCTSGTCAHNTHDPAAPMIRLVPLRGKLIELGTEEYENYSVTFYALLFKDKTVYFKLTEPEHYWATVSRVLGTSVPEYMLARLVNIQE